MDEFLSSKTMITPAIAGGITTLITAAVSTRFSLPGKWVGLAFSALLSVVVFFLDRTPPRLILRLLFLVLNTFIIFSIAIGANTAATAATTKPTSPNYELTPVRPGPKKFFHDWLNQ